VALLPFVTGKVSDQIAVYGWTIIKVSECVKAWVRVVGIDICLLCCSFERRRVDGPETLEVGAT
jgi:hypothetical protein